MTAPTPEQYDPWIFDGSQAKPRERAQMLRAVARAPRDDDSTTIERGAELIDALLDILAAVQEQNDRIVRNHSAYMVQAWNEGHSAGLRSVNPYLTADTAPQEGRDE